jgi:glycerol kinase
VLLAIDQGTTGTTCLVVDVELRILGRGYRELRQHFPAPGLVEHDADEIWETVLGAAEAALADADVSARELRAIGITNQRETTIVWDRRDGRPIGRAIVWQDRRTASRCAELPFGLIRERTGLVPDPYFSATKLEWLLREAGSARDLAFGTVDSWLVWKLSGGDHLTDVTNASRTMLLDIGSLEWDEDLLSLFGVPRSVLPQVVASSGELAEGELLGARIPITGVAGDQHAALFGQACFAPGQAKATFGTGSFVLVNAGTERSRAPQGILQTVAWRLRDEPPVYALEGSIFVAGAALQWLRDALGLLDDASESEALARRLPGNDGVYFVPALTGLGAPHWAPDARGLVTGLTRGTRREHLVRAALEAIAFQTRDVLDAMELQLELVRADGGAAANGFLLQLQADLTGVPVEVPAERETTAVGAAGLAGLGARIWETTDEIARAWRCAARYEPQLDKAEVERLLAGWRDAVRRTLL